MKSKKEKLEEQLTEAKALKTSIDRRSVTMSGMLQKYLSVDEFQEFQCFIRMKCQLIVDNRQLQERIAVSEEQLQAIKNS